jgi:hypothetical protein
MSTEPKSQKTSLEIYRTKFALPESRERLSGSIERITLHSEESGFCVLRVRGCTLRYTFDLINLYTSRMIHNSSCR